MLKKYRELIAHYLPRDEYLVVVLGNQLVQHIAEDLLDPEKSWIGLADGSTIPLSDIHPDEVEVYIKLDDWTGEEEELDDEGNYTMKPPTGVLARPPQTGELFFNVENL